MRWKAHVLAPTVDESESCAIERVTRDESPQFAFAGKNA
jgi:hypothetical protein